MLKFNGNTSRQAMANINKAKNSLNSAKGKRGSIPSDYSLAGDLNAIYSGIESDLRLLDEANSAIGANVQRNNQAEGANEKLIAEMMRGTNFVGHIASLNGAPTLANRNGRGKKKITGTDRCYYYSVNEGSNQRNYDSSVFVFGSGTGGEVNDYIGSIQKIVESSDAYGEVIGVDGSSGSKLEFSIKLAEELVKYRNGVDMVAYSGSGELEFAAAILTIQQGGKINSYTSLDSTGRLLGMKVPNGNTNVDGSTKSACIATDAAAAYAWMASKGTNVNLVNSNSGNNNHIRFTQNDTCAIQETLGNFTNETDENSFDFQAGATDEGRKKIKWCRCSD